MLLSCVSYVGVSLKVFYWWDARIQSHASAYGIFRRQELYFGGYLCSYLDFSLLLSFRQFTIPNLLQNLYTLNPYPANVEKMVSS